MKLTSHNSILVRKGDTWVRARLCDNSSFNTDVNYGRGIGLAPQCGKNIAEYDVTVIYNPKYGGTDTDSFLLCGECLKRLRRECRKRGYKVVARRIPPITAPFM